MQGPSRARQCPQSRRFTRVVARNRRTMGLTIIGGRARRSVIRILNTRAEPRSINYLRATCVLPKGHGHSIQTRYRQENLPFILPSDNGALSRARHLPINRMDRHTPRPCLANPLRPSRRSLDVFRQVMKHYNAASASRVHTGIDAPGEGVGHHVQSFAGFPARGGLSLTGWPVKLVTCLRSGRSPVPPPWTVGRPPPRGRMVYCKTRGPAMKGAGGMWRGITGQRDVPLSSPYGVRAKWRQGSGLGRRSQVGQRVQGRDSAEIPAGLRARTCQHRDRGTMEIADLGCRQVRGITLSNWWQPHRNLPPVQQKNGGRHRPAPGDNLPNPNIAI